VRRTAAKISAIVGIFSLIATTPALGAETPADSRAVIDRPSTKIVGGSDATIDEAPWQVALVNRLAGDDFNGQFCGGSILNAGWVVTAAHCVDWGIRARDLLIMAGSDYLSDTSMTGVRVSSIIIHPGWDPDSSDNDIALIKLRSPLSLQEGVAEAIQLPSNRPVVGTEALITGWGTTAFVGGDFPQQMQKALVDIYSDEYCQGEDVYGPSFSSNLMVCASADDFSRDTCQGDSGGPLAVFTDSRWELHGITSYGTGCAESPWPGVYAEVYQYVSWINSKVYSPPVASSLSPSSARVGDMVTLSGRNFFGVTAVEVNGTSVPSEDFTVVSDTRITFEVPEGASTGKVRVTNPAGSAATRSDLRILPPVGYPVLNSISPSRVRVGATVTVRGENFTGTTSVLVNGLSASFNVADGTRLTLVVPSGATSGKVSVTNGLGTTISDANLTIRR
jgi:secreted trypsin-like serine protease